MKAIAYARYSSDKQNETSIQAQLSAIEGYCARNGIELVRAYCDEAVSGTSDDRPEFQRMLKDLKDGLKADLVLVHKLDRFARNRYDAAVYRRCLQELGIRLIAVDQPTDDSPEGGLMETLLEGLAEYYSRNLARETMKGMTERAKEAKFLGGRVPYGYRVVEGKYEVNPYEAEAVKLAFRLFAEGVPVAEIARQLNARGYRTRAGNPWKSTSLHEMFSNPRYAGVYVWNLTPKKIAGKRNWRIKKPEKEVFRVEGGMPAIVEGDVWTKVQERLKKGARGTRLRIHDYALTGKAYCGLCGSVLIGDGRTSRGKKYAYYSCRARCGLRSWPKEELEERVRADLRGHCCRRNAGSSCWRKCWSP